MCSYMKISKALLSERRKKKQSAAHTKYSERIFTKFISVIISSEMYRIGKGDFCKVRKLTVRMHLCVNCIFKIKSLLGDGEWV